MNAKTIITGIIGGIVAFFLGWGVYGVLLAGWSEANMSSALSKPDDQMIMWAMALGNVVYGYFLAICLDWSGAKSPVDGLKTGAIVGFLVTLSYDLFFYSMTDIFIGGWMAVAVDCVVAAAFGAVVAAVMVLAGNKLPLNS